MAIIDDNLLVQVAKYMIDQTVDGQFGEGLTPDLVYATVKAALKSEHGGSLMGLKAFSEWLRNHHKGVIKWQRRQTP